MDWERVEWAVELLGTVKMTILTPFEKRLDGERWRSSKAVFTLCFAVNRDGAVLREIPQFRLPAL